MPINHAKVSILADGPDTNQVQPSNWNADHSAPTLAEVLAASPSTYAGVARVIGPFSVAWDDAGMDPENGLTGESIGPVLPVGTIVWSAAPLVTEEWLATDPVHIQFEIQAANTNAYQVVGGVYNLYSNMVPFSGDGFTRTMPGDPQTPVLVTGSAIRLLAFVYAPGLSAGAADIYALVQYP